MVTSEMISYIKVERAKQLSDKEIKAHLLAVGWVETDIDQALSAGMPTTEVNFLKNYRHKKMWKVFGFWAILLLAGLVWSLIGTGLTSQATGNIIQFLVLTTLAFLIAYSLTNNTLPKMGKGPESLDTIGKIIALLFVESGLILIAFLTLKVLVSF